jgi:hypothetical protein
MDTFTIEEELFFNQNPYFYLFYSKIHKHFNEAITFLFPNITDLAIDLEKEEEYQKLLDEISISFKNLKAKVFEKIQDRKDEKNHFVQREINDLIWAEISSKEPELLTSLQPFKTKLETMKSEQKEKKKPNQADEDIELFLLKKKIQDKKDELLKIKDTEIPELGTILPFSFRVNSRSFSFVLYAKRRFYSDNLNYFGDLQSICVPVNPERFLEQIKDLLSKLLGVKFYKVVMDHHHGHLSKRCSFVVACFMKENLRKSLDQFSIREDETGLNFTGFFIQASHSSSFRSFAEKKNIYLWREISEKGYLGIHPDMSVSEFQSHLMKHNPRDFLINAERMLNNFTNFIQHNDLPEFEWRWPKHFDEAPLKDKSYIKLIKEWFEKYCLPEDNERKKSLVLYSNKRGMGKTMFAQNLVNSEDYYIYNKGTFDALLFKKKKYAKLVIIDDIDYNQAHQQMWKALSSSQPVNIRTPYFNDYYGRTLPVIICTNSFKDVKNWSLDPLYSTQMYLLNIQDYLGPEKTYPSHLFEKKHDLGEEFEEKKKKNAFDLLKKKRK